MKTNKIVAALAVLATLWACQEKEDPIKPATPEVSVSPASVSFESDGGTFRVAVTTNVDTYTVTGNPDWLTVEQNGKEIVLTAAQNTVNEVRSCTLKVTADTASCDIAVSQKAGSPYSGFTVCKSATLEYGGIMLYQFMKPTEEDYGGWGTLSMMDEDGNSLGLWIYTDLFKSEEEVELTPGTYVKGNDDYLGLKLSAKKLTFMPGVNAGGDDDDYIAGCFYTSVATGTGTPLVDGTILVGEDGGKTLVNVDMTDEAGNAYKFVYVGDVTIDASSATYPSENERIDVAATIFAADCYYMGDKYVNGTTNYILAIYSGDPDNPAVTNFEFNAPACEFSESIDLTGAYSTPDEEAGIAPYSAGSIIPGELVELLPGFEFPMGTYIMYSFGDYLIGDAYDSLILSKAEDGTYAMMGVIMSNTGELVMFMGIEGLNIGIYDGRDDGSED